MRPGIEQRRALLNTKKTMKIKCTAVLFSAICTLCGCDDVKAKLHLMPNQDEQECLNSERLNFKDPDVLFVANLGDRGLGVKPDQYWVRYKAKNSYGAYGQGNMPCIKNASTGKWVMDGSTAYMVELQVAATLMRRETDLMMADSTYITRYRASSREASIALAKKDAQEIVFSSAVNLAEYVEKEK